MSGGSDREAGSGGRSVATGVRVRAVVLDVLIVTAWVVVVTGAWGVLPWPPWAYYVVVFGGIVGYSLLVAPFLESVGSGR